MRAMPSPVESTKPVSRTSSCFSYSLIWSRMTSLISAARICIDLFPPGPLGATLGHLLAQADELRPEAPVVHRAVDVEHHAPEELCIHLRRGQHLAPPGQPPGKVDEVVLLGPAEGRRRSDQRPGAPECVINQLLVGGRDVGQDVETIALRQQAEQVADARRELKRGRHLTRDAEPRARIDRWASQDELQARLLEHGGHAPGLLRRRDERVSRQREERTGVPLGEAAAAHYAALAAAMKSRSRRCWSPGLSAWRSRAEAWRTASSMSSSRSAFRAATNSCSASTRASARMRSAAWPPRTRATSSATRAWTSASIRCASALASAMRRFCSASALRTISWSSRWASLRVWSSAAACSARSRSASASMVRASRIAPSERTARSRMIRRAGSNHRRLTSSQNTTKTAI